MSDSNPFDDLAEDVEKSEDSVGNDTRAEVESQIQPEKGSDVEREQSTTDVNPRGGPKKSSGAMDTSRGASVEGPTLDNSSPPFPYSEAEQKQMYVQDGLWDEFEDMGFDAELELRRTFGVRNVEQRELDTAVIRLVLDRLTPRELAEMVIQMRGFDPSALD